MVTVWTAVWKMSVTDGDGMDRSVENSVTDGDGVDRSGKTSVTMATAMTGHGTGLKPKADDHMDDTRCRAQVAQ